MKKFKFCLILIAICAITQTFNLSKAFAQEQNVQSCAVVEVNSKRVLFEQNAKIPRPMASTTKVLTALTVLQNVDNLDKTVTIKKECCAIEGSSIYLREGEKLTIKELLYGLMLRSGNDAALALAIETCGSVKDFSRLMNSVAKSCGAVNSNFTNPHGLHDPNHYTTAIDLALISAVAMQNATFAQIVGTKSITIGSEQSQRQLYNKNKMLANYKGATGVKTGFTKKAGRCLVSSANKNNMHVVCVVLNCGDMFEKSTKLLDQAFEEYQMTQLFNAQSFNQTLPVAGTKKECVITCEESLFYPLKKQELSSVKIVNLLPKELTPPFKAGDEVGQIKIYLANQLLFCQKLYTIIGVKNKDYNYIVQDVIDFWQII